jgi:hypothetical protein
LAAAIAAVAYAIYDMTTAMGYQIDVQEELGSLNTKAQKSIASDLSNIDLLTTAIKDENTSFVPVIIWVYSGKIMIKSRYLNPNNNSPHEFLLYF